MPSAEIQPEVRDRLAGAVHQIAAQLVPDPERRAETLGEIFLACERAARTLPEECRAALERGALEAFLLPRVRASLRREASAGPRGGWLGTYIGPDARPVDGGATDPQASAARRDALELSTRALKRALSLARAEGNRTLVRNLGWYQERLAHRSYEAIARQEGRVPATIRTGVARARKFVLQVVHELRNGQPAPLSGEAPPEVEPLRALWVEQDLDALERGLEETRGEHAEDAHWLNLAALLAAERGRREKAVSLFEQALVFADAPSVRGRVLNNLGTLQEDLGKPEVAIDCWLRASQLVPEAPAPLLNLLASASPRRDYPAAQHYLNQLGALLSSGRLRADERAYVCRRLAEHPKLDWLRDTDAWRVGPARWIRAARAKGPTRVALAAASAVLVLALLLVPARALAGSRPQSGASAPIALVLAGDTMGFQRGGDSMGKPPRGLRPEGTRRLQLTAGDTMGRSGGRGGKRG